MSAALKMLRDYGRQPVLFKPDFHIAGKPDDWDDPYALVATPDFEPPAGPIVWAHRVDHGPPWRGDYPELALCDAFARWVAGHPLHPNANNSVTLSPNGWASEPRKRRRPSPPSRHTWSYAQQIDHVRRLAQRLVAALYYRPALAQDHDQLVKLTRSIAVNAASIRVRLEANRGG